MTEKLSLSELQLIIRDSLYMAFPDFYWVIAEICEMKENFSGHCYLELIEKQSDDQHVRAKVKAIIWSKRYRFLKSFFENITGESLREGLKILIKVKIEYSEIYGLSLIICDIDPAFTKGEMAVKRQAIINKLEAEGVFSMNKELSFPMLPKRIAVISSAQAAGYSDFINHLKGNPSGYVYHTALFESAMQGADTEEDIISALDQIAAGSDEFDLVAIIRGGGSQSDLSWFDNYNIAFHVTQFPLPVITGIGHDKDESVTDLVACKALKTPTAVADFIINCTSEAEGLLMNLSINLMNTFKTIIERNNVLIDTLKTRLLPEVRIMLAGLREELSKRMLAISNIGKGYISKAGLLPADLRSRLLTSVKAYYTVRENRLVRNEYDLVSFTSGTLKSNFKRLENLENILQIVKPENVLRRGYTITSSNGKILKTKSHIKPNDIIDTHFIDGNVKSKVSEFPD